MLNTTITGKHGKGVITAIITKSTGYVQVQWESGKVTKEMAFNLKNEAGEPVKAKPVSATAGMSKGEKKRYNDRQALVSYNALSNLEKIKSTLLGLNGLVQGDRSSMSYQIIAETLAAIWLAAKEANNSFVLGVHDAVDKYMRCSEKQAYVLAKFADENNITLPNL